MTTDQKSGNKSAKKKSRKKTPRRKKAPRLLSGKSRKVFRQCIYCGGIVDQMYGKGDGSYCPLCFGYDSICEEIGQLPDPQMYGSWLAWQEEAEEERQKEIAEKDRLDNLFGNPSSAMVSPEKKKLKTRKKHTGVFSCPDCCVAFDLFMDESLKCDDCDGLLISGSLDTFVDDEDDTEY